MIDNILIHIGYHKTGSTWLQKELFTSENNVFEPLSTKSSGQSSLTKFFITSNDGYLLSPYEFNSDTIRKEINSILKLKNNLFKTQIPVLSSERLSGNPHSGGFDSKIILSRIKNIFPKAKIFIVIREQKSYILSNYFQYIDKGGMLSIKKYLNQKYDAKIPFFSPYHLDYFLLVKEYIKQFGKENVLVLPYEMFNTKPSLFITFLTNFINKKININKEIFLRFWNKRNYYFIRYHLRFLNIFRPKTSVSTCSIIGNKYFGLFITFLINFLGVITPDYFDKGTLKKTHKYIDAFTKDRYIESNRRLSELINIDLSHYGYY